MKTKKKDFDSIDELYQNNTIDLQIRIKLAIALIGLSIFITIAMSGFVINNGVNFNFDFYNNNRLFVWTNILLIILTCSVLLHLIDKKAILNELKSLTFFNDNSTHKEFLEKMVNPKGRFNKKIQFIFILLFLLIAIFGVFSHYQFVEPKLNSREDSLNSFFCMMILIYGYLLVTIAPLDNIESFIAATKLNYKFKFSDKTGGVKKIIQYLNSSLILNLNIIVCLILFIYSCYTNPDIDFSRTFRRSILYMGNDSMINHTVTKIIFNIVLLFFSSIFMFGYSVVKITPTIKAYRKIINDLNKDKIKYLKEIEKKGDLESIIMYDKIQQMKIISPIDKITMPLKLLLSPTIMTYLRGKILLPSDIDIYIRHLFQ